MTNELKEKLDKKLQEYMNVLNPEDMTDEEYQEAMKILKADYDEAESEEKALVAKALGKDVQDITEADCIKYAQENYF